MAKKIIWVSRMAYMRSGMVADKHGRVTRDVDRALVFENAQAAHTFALGEKWVHRVGVSECSACYFLADACGARMLTPVQ